MLMIENKESIDIFKEKHDEMKTKAVCSMFTYSVWNKYDKVFDIVLIEDNILMFDCLHCFVYSIIIAVMDYHGNYTGESNLWILGRYRDEL